MGHGIIIRTAVSAFAMLAASVSFGADAPDCPKVDPTKKDKDGIAYCPDIVKENNAFTMFRCTVNQARTWHAPKDAEITNMRQMLQAFKEHDYATMLVKADAIRLQICRVENGDDKYLVFQAKPGAKDYNGPAMMLRDAAKVSKLWIIAPHTGSDGYFAAAPSAFQDSHALAYFQNGHKKGLGAGSVPGAGGRPSDFSHTKDTLGYWAVRHFSFLYPKLIVSHWHGMSAPDHVLYRPLKGPLAKHFESAVTKFTGMKDFRGFNAFYEIDPPATNTGWYVKTELPARIYRNQPKILAKIMLEWEKNDWAWNTPVVVEPTTPEVEPEPTTEEVEPEEEDVEDVENEETGGEETEGTCETPDEEIEQAEPEASPTPVPGTAFKPERRPVKGKRDLICIAVKYKGGNHNTDIGRCRELAQKTARFWTNQSRGRLELTAKAITITSPSAPSVAAASKAAAQAKSQYPNALFLLPRTFFKGNSNAGGRVANLTSYANATHEVGHLLGLGHCGRYKSYNPTTGVWGDMDGYGGGGCVMSGLAGSHIDPRQYLHEDWLEANEWTVYGGTAPQKYTLRKISQIGSKAEGLITVVVPSEIYAKQSGSRNMYLAYSDKCQKDPCIGVYLAQGGGSQRVGVFGKEFKHGPSGLTIKNLGFDGEKRLQIEVSVVAPTPKPRP